MTEQTTESSPKSLPFRLGRRQLLVAAGIVILVAAGSLLVWWRQSTAVVAIPASVIEKVLFPVYTIDAQPPGYRVDPNSFDTSQGVLIFSLTDNNGHKIVLSEQSIPQSQDYDIATFQQKSLNNSKSLPAAPFSSVIGQTDDKAHLVSIQAEHTWIIATTKTAGTDAILEFIAKHIIKAS